MKKKTTKLNNEYYSAYKCLSETWVIAHKSEFHSRLHRISRLDCYYFRILNENELKIKMKNLSKSIWALIQPTNIYYLHDKR